MPFPSIAKDKIRDNSDAEYKPGVRKFEHECFNSAEVYQGTVTISKREALESSWEYLLSSKLIKAPQFSEEWYDEIKERQKNIEELTSFDEGIEDRTLPELTEYKDRLRERKRQARSEKSSTYSVSQTSSKRRQPKRRENYKIMAIESLSNPVEIRKINIRKNTVRVLVYYLNAVYQFDAKTEGFAVYQLSKKQYNNYLNRIQELKGKRKSNGDSGDEEEEEDGSGEEEEDDDDGILSLFR